MNDQAIISLFEQRNEQAISESNQQYGALCRSVARDITGNDEDAEECLNDAMLAAWNAIPPAKPKNFCAYLLKLVRNAAHDRYRAAHTMKRNTANIAGSIDELAEIIPDRGDSPNTLQLPQSCLQNSASNVVGLVRNPQPNRWSVRMPLQSLAM